MGNEHLSSNISDTSFTKFADSRYIDVKKIKITYNYITMSRVIIENSNFSNCDIIGSRLSDIQILNVNLSNADIISNEINEAIFKNVNFDGASIDDINFKDCKFIDCNFNNLSMKNCMFYNCYFENISPLSSLMELNTYFDCRFNSCKFTSSFHYQIFDSCNFNDVLIKAELLGYNYGLYFSSGVETGLKLLDYHNDNNSRDAIISDLAKYFINQYLFINAMILMLNTDTNTNQILFLNWANTLKKTLNHNNIIKSNELNFIKNVLVNMFEKNLIVPIVMIDLYNQLIDIYKNYQYSDKTEENLLVLINSMYKEIQIYITNLNNEINELPSYDEAIEIAIKYNTKPLIPLCNLLNEFGVGKSIQTKTMKGSFLEWIEAPENILACLNVFISLLGITVPIVVSNIKEKKNKKNDKKDANSSLPQIFVNVDNITLNVNIQNGCQIINNNQFLQNNFCGYTNENIEYIRINPKK